jgi:hypothetical protein
MTQAQGLEQLTDKILALGEFTFYEIYMINKYISV